MIKVGKYSFSKKYLIMGILNFTPDSFSDGGDFFDEKDAIEQVEKMLLDGADIIDIGAESTRPGSVKISAKEEIHRLEKIVPVLLKKFPDTIFSIDTYKSEVADYALSLGVHIINDVYGAKGNDMSEVAKKHNAPIIVMHNGGVSYGREILEVYEGLKESINICLKAGVDRKNIIVDPGMGFGKDFRSNIEITKKLSELKKLDCDILYAVSRKRTTNEILGGDSLPKDRDVVSATLSLEAIRKGAKIVRVHNVKVMKEVIDTYLAVEGSQDE